MKKEIFVCDTCGCENIQVQVWVNVNSGEPEDVIEDYDGVHYYCPDCNNPCEKTTLKHWKRIQDAMFPAKNGKKGEVNSILFQIYNGIGIDKPSNHDAILEFVYDDINETAHETEWTTQDVSIAFRRFIELANE